MADFNKGYEKTMAHEGGYVNDPSDSGGETYRGVSRKNFPFWEGWKDIDRLKKEVGFPANLLSEQQLTDKVKNFYKTNFWDKMLLDSFKSQDIAEELFDTGVNCGSVIAAKFLQRTLNILNNQGKLYNDISVDGIIGTTTLNLCNRYYYPEKIYNLLNVMQGAKYIEIAERNSTQEKFIAGWLNRVQIIKK